ncbi:MAG: N-acetylmuramoyl-L-alanine amidase [Clostridiales bacterium]|jgi:hypothetical protein|nr:N-acetylmuramoyl-L-alanine amidase [Clostridiales bacterium]
MAYKLEKKLCPKGLKNNPNSALKSIDYITIHNTGNYSPGATAQMHANYQYNGSGGAQTSWHYTVDDKEVWKSFEDNQMCWHAGNTAGNQTSIGIEICDNNKSVFRQACDNTAQLTADLLKKHNLTVNKIRQHYDWSGKNCPAEIRSGTWGITWTEFLQLVEKYYCNAADIGYPILGAPTCSVEQMTQWAKNKKAADWFVNHAKDFNIISIKAGVNPVVTYCQSAKETGFGRFGGVINESYCNTCGIKTLAGGGDYEPSAHMRFATWEKGIQAQADHLALYAGHSDYPKKDSPDPKQLQSLSGKAKTVEALSGLWAPSPGYGADIVKMIREVEKTVAEQKNDTALLNAPSDWAKEAWAWAKNNEYNDGLRPKDLTTREEVAALLYRYHVKSKILV